MSLDRDVGSSPRAWGTHYVEAGIGVCFVPAWGRSGRFLDGRRKALQLGNSKPLTP